MMEYLTNVTAMDCKTAYVCGTGTVVETLNDKSHWIAPYHMSAKLLYIHGHAELLSEPSLTKTIIY